MTCRWALGDVRGESRVQLGFELLWFGVFGFRMVSSWVGLRIGVFPLVHVWYGWLHVWYGWPASSALLLQKLQDSFFFLHDFIPLFEQTNYQCRDICFEKDSAFDFDIK